MPHLGGLRLELARRGRHRSTDRSPERPDRNRLDSGSQTIATGIPSGGSDLARTMGELAALTPLTAGIRRWGSASLDLAYVACGRFEAFWEIALAPWDIAAGVLLIREAGGIVTDLAGAPIQVAHTGLVTGNPAMHAWLLDVGVSSRA